MKTNSKLVVGLLAFTFLTNTVQAQLATWWPIVNVPVKKSSAKIHMAQMRKALPFLLAGETIPTNRVPLVARVEYQEDPFITPETLICTGGGNFFMWKKKEVPKKTKDPALKEIDGEEGNSLGEILKWEGDGYNPLPLSNLVLRAELFTLANTNINIPPSAFYFIGYTYKKDVWGDPLMSEDGMTFAKTYRTSLSANGNKSVAAIFAKLKKSKILVDSFDVFWQFGTNLSINASTMAGASNQDKINQASDLALEQRADLNILAAFIEAEGTEDAWMTDYSMTFFWLFEAEEKNQSPLRKYLTKEFPLLFAKKK